MIWLLNINKISKICCLNLPTKNLILSQTLSGLALMSQECPSRLFCLSKIKSTKSSKLRLKISGKFLKLKLNQLLWARKLSLSLSPVNNHLPYPTSQRSSTYINQSLPRFRILRMRLFRVKTTTKILSTLVRRSTVDTKFWSCTQNASSTKLQKWILKRVAITLCQFVNFVPAAKHSSRRQIWLTIWICMTTCDPLDVVSARRVLYKSTTGGVTLIIVSKRRFSWSLASTTVKSDTLVVDPSLLVVLCLDNPRHFISIN